MDNIASGVWPTMVTPYTKDNKIDYRGVEKLLDFYYGRGVDGVFAICQSSEMFFLDIKEKVELIRFICGNIPGDLQVVVSGHTGNTLEEQIREADAIMCEGVKAYVILPNRFAEAEESDDILIDRMEKFISGFPDIPLGIYECPYPYKRLLTPKVLKWCIETGRFIFIKDTCCNLEQIGEKLRLLAGSGIKLFNANSATLLESLKMGAQGYSGIMANIHPEFYTWLCHNFQEFPEKAERVQQFVGSCSMAEYQYYPVNAKYSLFLQGIPIEIRSRVLEEDKFTERFKLEIQQLNQLSLWAREKFSI